MSDGESAAIYAADVAGQALPGFGDFEDFDGGGQEAWYKGGHDNGHFTEEKSVTFLTAPARHSHFTPPLAPARKLFCRNGRRRADYRRSEV